LSAGFTLIELVLVVTIIGVVSGFAAYSFGTFSFWKDEGFVRKLSELVVFLHHQAIADQAFYRLNINFGTGSSAPFYTVGAMRPEEDVDSTLKSACSSEAGSLSCELASVLSPSLGITQTEIPPPSFPSLGERVYFPDGVSIVDVRTMRGKATPADGGSSFVMFSPRGFSEFAVFHLKLSGGAPVTILVNPFTGNTEIYREYKDFEWTHGKKESRMK